jgi:hypothetical protein
MQSTSTVVPPDFSLATSSSTGGRRGGGVLGVLDILPPFSLFHILHRPQHVHFLFPFPLSLFLFFLLLLLLVSRFISYLFRLCNIGYYPAVLVERPVLLPGALPVGCTCFSVSSIIRTSNNVVITCRKKKARRKSEKKRKKNTSPNKKMARNAQYILQVVSSVMELNIHLKLDYRRAA